MLRPSRRTRAALAAALLVVADCSSDTTTATPIEPPLATARWSDAASWPGGVVPVAGADVTIPTGTAILLDVSPPPLKTLVVAGALEFDRRDLALTAERIEVAGTLRVGTESSPFMERATITLTGTPDATAPDLGLRSKALAVMPGGTLDLHGAPRVGWTRLAASVPLGATEITLERAVDWHVGDRIVLTATDFDPAQYDEAEVTAVSGSRVTLAAPLKYAHWGAKQTIAGRTVDERGEVGLLTRNVQFRGDSACAGTGYCAHIITFKGGTMRVEGTALYLVGQKFALARYPIHWHVADDVTGQYARNNSIWKSFNRCITVHGSHAASVEGNVCHDHLGHGYFLEDGVEARNSIVGNLGVLGRVPAAAERLLASDSRPATFWITNPDNTVRGNVAAGSMGFGFWYALPEHPTGLSTSAAVWPRHIALREFAGNVAHSNKSGGLNVDDGPMADGTTETTNYAPRVDPAQESAAVPADFRDFFAYKHRARAVWLRGRALRLTNAVLADNGIGATFAANDTYLQDALLIGETANNATAFPAGFPVRGFEYYDGLVGAQRVTFANYLSSARGPASAFGFNRKNAFPLHPLNFAEGARYENANHVYIENPVADKDGDKAAVFLDKDGTVTGTAGRYVAANVPLLLTTGCVAQTEWNAYVCGGGYGRLEVRSSIDGENPAPATVTRDDGVALALAGAGNSPASLQLSVPLARGYTLALASALTQPRIGLWGVKPGDWVRVSLPYAGTSVVVYRDYYTGNKVTAAASLAELASSNGDKYYLAGGVLYLKLMVQANRDYTTVHVTGAP
ncbi:MAG: transmembrane domain-containing protein [Gemmatimonadetes bacterium]|nr:MAG: transmembrane domain-containing protein [Gemmatimonadota bacterium]